MGKLVLNIPDSAHVSDIEAKILFAARLFEMGKLSLGQAADVAGYSKRTFMELLGSYNVSVFNYTGDDLEKDLQNAKGNNI